MGRSPRTGGVQVDSKNKEIETEDHLKQLVEREAVRPRPRPRPPHHYAPPRPRASSAAQSARCSCGVRWAQGRLRGDVFKLEKEQAELLEKMNSLQNQVYRGNEKMDQFKLLMNVRRDGIAD